jgi:predicted enzyme related to lactoylglutathione lyase
MSQRDHYPSGVPCWVETLQPNPKAAVRFYGALFGWECSGPAPMPGDPPGQHFVARVGGRDVAGIGSLPQGGGTPAWTTYIRVSSADETVERAKRAGGSLHDGPFDVLPAGRMAVLADPTDAVFCAWEAGAREGAQLVNEPRAWAMSLLHTTDPAGAKAFYGEVFSWRTEPFGPPGAQVELFRLPGYTGGEPQQPVPRDVVAVAIPIGLGGSPGEERSYWSVDFWVDDADATAKRAASLGGRIVVPAHDVPGFRNSVLADPQGPVFSVSQLMRGR